MRIKSKDFTESTQSDVTLETHTGPALWRVWPRYEVSRESGEVYVSPPPHRTRSEEISRLLTEHEAKAGDIVNTRECDLEHHPRVYKPLVDTPGLFLEFARLADREIDEETWLSWVHRYGDLGKVGYSSHPKRLGGGVVPQPDDHIRRSEKPDRYGRGGYDIRLDSLSGFRWFSWLANHTLKLYELATAPYGVDADAIAGVLLDDPNSAGNGLVLMNKLKGDTEYARHSALIASFECVQEELQAGAFPRLLFKDPKKPTKEMTVSWGFHTLLGAMFIQMMWLMTATDGVRRCSGPGCSAVVYFETPEPHEPRTSSTPSRKRKDAQFCSGKCKQAHWRHKQKSGKR